MNTHLRRVFDSRVVLALVVLTFFALSNVQAAPTTYVCVMDGPSESPPNASPADGNVSVTIDPVAHTMVIHLDWVGLLAGTSAAHIHGPTAVAGTGTASPMTTTPYFAGFPIGVTSGSYDNAFNTLAASTYGAAFYTANGSNAATAEATMFAAIAAGKAYMNVHSTLYTGGEIRGFLVPAPVRTEASTWGSIKALYR